jgi:hypothetical protein
MFGSHVGGGLQQAYQEQWPVMVRLGGGWVQYFGDKCGASSGRWAVEYGLKVGGVLPLSSW